MKIEYKLIWSEILKKYLILKFEVHKKIKNDRIFILKKEKKWIEILKTH